MISSTTSTLNVFLPVEDLSNKDCKIVNIHDDDRQKAQQSSIGFYTDQALFFFRFFQMAWF